MIPAKLIALNGRYYLISTDNICWLEGNAIDLRSNELIYYNGDYNDERPEYIKKVLAEPYEIGWVRHLTDGSPFVSKFEDVLLLIVPIIRMSNGNCFLEDEKIEGKYVIKLLS